MRDSSLMLLFLLVNIFIFLMFDFVILIQNTPYWIIEDDLLLVNTFLVLVSVVGTWFIISIKNRDGWDA